MVLPHDLIGAGPVLVLLHAGIADRTMWAEHLQPLADAGFRVVAIDLPGCGEASDARVAHAPWSDVLSTMDGLAIERASLVGNSFGGAVALRVAIVAPDRVEALALVSAPFPGLGPSPELQAAWDAEDAALQRGDIEGAVAAILNAWTLPDGPPHVRERVAAMQRQALGRHPNPSTVPEAPDPAEERPGALANIAIRALVAWGEHDMPDFQAAGEALLRTLPHARRWLVKGAGHLAPLEQPETFRAELVAFLREPSL